MSSDKPPSDAGEPTPDARRRSKLGRWVTGWLEGLPGVAMVLLVGVLGHIAVWLAYVDDKIGLADAIASEGVIIAVIFGVPALRAALHHDEDLDRVARKLNAVSDSVLTRTLGSFPDFFRYVPALLSKADAGVRIMCDNPAYAIVSDGENFDRYLEQLKRCIGRSAADRDYVVDLMFLDSKEREELHKDQSKDGWAQRQLDEKDTLQKFLDRADRLSPPSADRAGTVPKTVADLDFPAYIQRLKEVNENILTNHLYGANRQLLQFRDKNGRSRARTSGPSIYFWMRDNAEAIFVIVPLGRIPGPGREVAFTTHDPNMIKALNGVFHRYAAGSTGTLG